MAIMYPTHLDHDVETSEREVYECLRDGIPDDWHAMHSKRVTLPSSGGESAFEGELDFLIIHPHKGVLALEVKGGREIGRDNRGWYSRSHTRGTGLFRIKDPGKQAQTVMHKLMAYVKNHTDKPDLKELGFGWGVAFPGFDIDNQEGLGPELPPTLILDRKGLGNPEQVLQGMYKHWEKAQEQPLSSEAHKEIIDLLMPVFELTPSLTLAPQPIGKLGREITRGEKIIHRLTNEQNRIINAMAENRRLSVMGPAGTGKTMVAMGQARRLAASGMKVLFLCYNRPLAEDLKKIAEGFHVQTFHGLCHDVVTRAGRPFRIPQDNSKKSKKFWGETAAEELLAVLEEDPRLRWDAVIVDEGQDFKDLWWIAVERLLSSEEDGTLYVFHDPDQNLFGGGSIKQLGLTPVKLFLNCRNTRNIGESAYGFLGLQPSFPGQAHQGVQLKEISCGNDREMLEGVRRTIHHLVNEEQIPAEQIIVLSPKSQETSKVWKKHTFGNFRLVGHGEVLEPNQVHFSSIPRFKGLEAHVVIMCEVDHGSRRCSPKHLYVGASRAKHALVILKYSRNQGGEN